MNVGILIRGVYPQKIGGQELHGNLLIKKLLTKNVELYIISNVNYPKVASKNHKFHFFTTSIPKIPVLKFIMKFLINFLTLTVIHKKKKLNLIHGHGTIAEGLTSTFFSKLFKVKSVITVHGGGVYSFGRRFPFILSYITRNANEIIVTNDFLKQEILKYIQSEKKIHLIPNSLLLERFKPLNKNNLLSSNFQEYKNKFVLITVGRLEKIKDQDLLLEIVHSLSKKIPNLILLIIGSGNLRKKLEGKAQKLGISTIVKFLGEVKNINLPNYYNLAHIFISLSEIEGQGISILEAMACGCLVIASNVGGIKYSIKNNYNGFLVTKRNRNEIENLILEIYENKRDVEKIKLNARNEMEKNFNWDKNFEKILALYKNIT